MLALECNDTGGREGGQGLISVLGNSYCWHDVTINPGFPLCRIKIQMVVNLLSSSIAAESRVGPWVNFFSLPPPPHPQGTGHCHHLVYHDSLYCGAGAKARAKLG